jgi:hypothetical protein
MRLFHSRTVVRSEQETGPGCAPWRVGIGREEADAVDRRCNCEQSAARRDRRADEERRRLVEASTRRRSSFLMSSLSEVGPCGCVRLRGGVMGGGGPHRPFMLAPRGMKRLPGTIIISGAHPPTKHTIVSCSPRLPSCTATPPLGGADARLIRLNELQWRQSPF